MFKPRPKFLGGSFIDRSTVSPGSTVSHLQLNTVSLELAICAFVSDSSAEGICVVAEDICAVPDRVQSKTPIRKKQIAAVFMDILFREEVYHFRAGMAGAYFSSPFQ
jgi:hypothetical protein